MRKLVQFKGACPLIVLVLLQYMFYYKDAVIAFSVLIFLFEFYLSVRQHRRLLNVTERPVNLQKLMSEKEFNETRAYSLDKSYFGMFTAVVSQIVQLVWLYYDCLPLFWTVSMWLCGGHDAVQNEIWNSIVFVTLTTLFNSVTMLPFSLYSTFVIEEKHGFNKQTISLFFMDMFKSYALGAVIGFPLIAAFLTLVNYTGDQFYFYAWLMMVAVQLVMITFYPTYIQPLFNKVEPLPENSLKQKIEEMAKKCSFPLTKIFVIDGSKRSNHSNAYFYGFFKNKRIVLFDTLLEQVDKEEEIVAVLCHEIGHWYSSHSLRMLAIAQLHLLSLFAIFSMFRKSVALYLSFGFDVQTLSDGSPYTPTIVSFFLFSLIYSPIESVISFLMNVISRHHEFQADEYAGKKQDMAAELKQALLKISVKNRGMMWPDWMYSMYHHSHPPILQRLDALGGMERAEKPRARRVSRSPSTERGRKEKFLFDKVLQTKQR